MTHMALHEKHYLDATSSIPRGDSEDNEVFGNEKQHDIRFRTLTWPFVAFIMCTEVVTVGTIGFPQAFAVVGLVPGVIVSVFCGIFALYTALLLIDFKLNHPEVHSMGDAGYILFEPFKLGWLGREVLSAGTVIFSVLSAGGMLFSGGLALAALSDQKLCMMVYEAIFTAAMLILSVPRTFDFGLQYFSLVGFFSILISAIVAMIGAGVDPVPGRHIDAAIPQSFSTAFLTITNPVIAYAGHFMFFPLMSEMKQPRDAKKSAWFLQVFATTLYVLFGVVTYVYLGETVTNPSYLSLPSVKWAKAAWGLLIPNVLCAGALYLHVAAKIVFVRIFRKSPHLHSHTILSWSVWISLLVIAAGIAYVLAVGVAVFYLLAGLAAAAFASWYTYGLAGAFWWHDTHQFGHAQAYKYSQGFPVRGWAAIRKRPIGFTLAILTLLAGGFICVAGLYAIIKGIVDAYASGQVGQPFSCSIS